MLTGNGRSSCPRDASAHANFAVTLMAGDQVPEPSTLKQHNERTQIHLTLQTRDLRVEVT
jgi:hypothetical protein